MTAAAPAEERVLSVGGRTTVILEGLGAAGFRWSALVADPEILSVELVQQDGGETARLPGNSADEVFALVGLAIGETVVRFHQTRSFEPERPPHATRELWVKVVSG